MEGDGPKTALEQYADDSSERYAAMVDTIGRKIGVTSLRYQQLNKMIKAIGLPQEKVCTYCWTGKSKGIPSDS
jgi:amidophosphoribosyltransferase